VPICETCGRNFKTDEILEAHKKQMNHYKVNTPCPVCGRRFSDEKKLTEHMKTHEETSIGCPVCSKRFVDEKKLTDHIKRMHPDFKEPPQESPEIPPKEITEIKEGGSGVEKPASEEISKDPANIPEIRESVQSVGKIVEEKIVENNKSSEVLNKKEGEQAKAGVEKDILGVKPPPKLKPKKFLFPRIGKKNTFLITYLGRFYFEFILPDFPKEMQDELAETIADAVIEFIKKHKETTFSIIRAD
jgi:hypothetical protein